MKVAILGYGLQGKSSFDYFNSRGHDITILDKNHLNNLPSGVKSKFGDNYLDNLSDFDLIVRSPKVHPKDIVKVNGSQILAKVTSNTNLFFDNFSKERIIGVTGTKGKGTTSALLTDILRGIGKKVHLGGNFGTPPLDLLKEDLTEEDLVVLELASFQLVDIKHSPHIGVCLIVEPEHLDWHADESEYYQAKKQMFKYQSSEDIAIYYSKSETSKDIASGGNGKLIPYYDAPGAFVKDDGIYIGNNLIVKTNELQLLGKHNYQNVCAAITAAWQISQDAQAISKAIKDFKPLPFRIELIREVNGIKFYNDSFSSAPTSAIAAIEAVAGSKVLILGGMDRGLDLTKLSTVVADNKNSISHVLIIGASGQRLATCLDKVGFKNYQISQAKDMVGIVNEAKDLASNGSSVVLSPGFPSFDMFLNFEDRGKQFNQAVRSL